MPQQTNLNVSPYFDDFNDNKDFHKVLFKPGFPVQARELTTLQSILQSQIEKFGDHFFKEGSQIIPGSTVVDLNYYGVRIDSSFFGVSVSSYLDKLIGIKIKGSTSGVTAVVSKVLDSTESDEGFVTLYVKYQDSNPNSEFQVFQSGESLITNSNIIYGSTLIQAGTTFANTISNSASFKASSASISNGVFFVRGNFVSVSKQSIILDQYKSRPSARIGLLVNESIVSSLDDSSLNDNSQGFSNYAAPGADRLKVHLQLFKKDIDDFNDQNFIELIRIKDGVIASFVEKTEYNVFAEELARRTYDESGDYVTKSFDVFPRETLNNNSGNNGLFDRGSVTPDGNAVSDDLLTYKIMPGKAYVRGHEIQRLGPTYLDVEKPRTTVGVSTTGTSIEYGTVVKVNNINGSPTFGYRSDSIATLKSGRKDQNGDVTGTTVGKAKIISISSDDRYKNPSSTFDLYLYDIQTFTNITVNTVPSELASSSFVKGKSSGASGFVEGVSGGTVTLIDIKGQFLKNEPLIINGLEDNDILVTEVEDFNLGDVKSLSQTGFSADTILNKLTPLAGPGTEFVIEPNGIVSCSKGNLVSIVRKDDILIYTNPDSNSLFTYNKVSSVTSSRTLSIESVPSVGGINIGTIPTSSVITSSIFVIRPSFTSKNEGFFANLKYRNVESVDLSQGDINLIHKFDGLDGSSGQIIINLDNLSDFQNHSEISWKDIGAFYHFSKSDGNIIEISRSDVEINDRTIIISVGAGAGNNCSLITTLDKKSVKSKEKKFNGIGDLTISRSKYSSINGLQESSVYGTRVEDDSISLNCADVYRVYGIYESKTSDDPSLPTIKLTNITGSSGTDQDFVEGETIQSVFGTTKAIVVKRKSNNILEIQYINGGKFLSGESILSASSSITAKIESLTVGDDDIFGNYYFDNGIRSEFYDYSRLIKSDNKFEPRRKIRVIYQKYSVDSSNKGDFFSANSYSPELYQSISFTNYRGQLIRNSDLIDFRPRVKDYDMSSNVSPFEFRSRDFSADSDHSQFSIAPKSILEIAFDHYVGRIDKIFLTRDGEFIVQKGVASRSPQEPSNEDSALLIGTAYLPPYVFNARQVKFIKTENKRYTMKDIAKLESRLSNVEFYTSLSLLETDTNSLSIKDPTTGLDRFKSGFYVDNFSTLQLCNTGDPSWGCSIDTKNNLCRPAHNTPAIDLQLGSSAIPGVTELTTPNADLSFVTDLGNPNVKKTGDLITLDYEEEEYQSQGFATRTENVNPFNIVNWIGSIELEPESDIWVATNQLEVNNITLEGSYQAFMDLYPPEADGWSAIQWNAWEENISGRTETTTNIGSPIETSRIQGESNWEKTGKIERDRVHIMSNGAGTVIDSGDNQLANALIDSLSEGVVSRDSNGAFLIDADSAAGIRLTERFGAPDASGQLIGSGGTEFQFVEGGAGNALGSGFLRNLQRQGITPGTPEALALQQQAQTRNGGARFGTADSGLGEVEIERRRTDTVTTEQQIEIETTHEFNRTGIRYQVTESIDTQSLGNKVVSRDVIPYMRFRNVEFISKRLKPLTRVYPFFDSINMGGFIVPKLLEVKDITGEFVVGEIVQGLMPEDNPDIAGDGVNPRIRFRLANPNHKYGPYNNPSSTYTNIPYDPDSPMETEYSESSSILNVDTFGLSSIEESGIGWVGLGMKLVGQTSGAEATISNVRLVTDENGSVRGCLFIPDSSVTKNPKFETGTKTFRLTDSSTNSLIGGTVNTSAQSNFFAQGELENLQEDTISIRNAKVIADRSPTQQKFETTTVQDSIISESQEVVVEEVRWIDPLCQSFVTGEGSGVFVSSIDIYFKTKSDSIPVTCQIRTLRNGNPTQIIPAFGEVTLEPESVSIFDANGSSEPVATRFTFPSLVYLEANKEYGITLLSNSDEYNVYIARMGEVDIFGSSQDDGETQTIVSQQPSAGVLFKSQNGSTWTANQFEDLTYKINKAKFKETNGTVRFYSPILSEDNNQIKRLRDNPLIMASRQIKIKASTVSSITPGEIVNQVDAIGNSTGFNGIITGSGGALDGVQRNDNGSNLINGTYSGIELRSSTGSGAKFQIVVSGGEISSISGESQTGFGYQLGQKLTIKSDKFNNSPSLTVSNVTGSNSLFLTDVQGTYNINLDLLNSSGSTIISSNSSNSTEIFPNNTRDGLHMNVVFYSHGMHASNNIVKLSNIRTDVKHLLLRETISKDSTSDILIADSIDLTLTSSHYSQFEGMPVSDTNPGYIKIGGEIIRYTSLVTNGFSGITRGLFDTVGSSHSPNNFIEKYELNNICLARLNTQHNFAMVDISDNTARSLDSFYVKIDRSGRMDGNVVLLTDRRSNNTNNYPELFFRETKIGGGVNVKSSKNLQFELVHPNVQTFTPAETTINASVRTISATSIGAYQNDISELSFQDEGFEEIVLNENNYFDTPRMVASRVNELQFLPEIPDSRSFTLELNLNSLHKDISPVVDITRVNAILTTNRIDSPVSDFASDGSIMSSITEPHSAVYLTQAIRLEQPATSIKVMLLGNRPEGTDIRALYKILRNDGPVNSEFELFPGYNNLGDNSEVLDPGNSDGLPDKFVPINASDIEYSDYEFSIDNLPEYELFQIKIIFTSTNQAVVPKIKDLRVIALA